MIEQILGGNGGDNDSSASESEPASESDQAAAEAETLFEEFTKSLETGENNKDK